MATYLITGTSRGIGLELVKQLLDLPNTRVSKIFAVTRNAQSTALQKLIDVSGNRIQNVTVDDITDETNVQKALSNVEKALQGQGLDVLINNAGVQPFSPKLCDVPAQQLVDVFNVNVVSAHIFTAAALPLLRKGRERRIINMSVTRIEYSRLSRELTLCAFRSTVMGSIAYAPHFKVAPTHAYKISKAAMNMLNAQYALEYGDEGFTFLAISPGVSIRSLNPTSRRL